MSDQPPVARLIDAIIPTHSDGVVYVMMSLNVGLVFVAREDRGWCNTHHRREVDFAVAQGLTCPIHGTLRAIDPMWAKDVDL